MLETAFLSGKAMIMFCSMKVMTARLSLRLGTLKHADRLAAVLAAVWNLTGRKARS
jgi:hypothetical protein